MSPYFYRSGSIQERAEELNVLIRNPNISCIMSTIGGMNSSDQNNGCFI
ncbi:LD-carboxypeptidase [Bacillus sp. HC-Mk]